MNILFTGASSFTGYWFAAKLAEAGHKLVAPLSRPLAAYEDVAAERVRRLALSAEIVADCPFGSPAFLALAGERAVDVLCHHAGAGEDADGLDVAAALAADTLNLRRSLPLLRERGLKAVVATGSAQEPGEGVGARAAASPYGLARRFGYETLRYWGEAAGAPVSKFVVAEAFGPFEPPRYIDYALRCWAEGAAAEAPAASALSDHIHVDLLALAYAGFVAEAGQGGPARRLAPCGYLESKAAFAGRLARELGRRLGYEGRVAVVARVGADEPEPRFNTEPVDGVALGWREDSAWDALASYYRRRGFGAAPRAAVELRGAVDVASHALVSGWLTDKRGGNPRFVRICVDGRELGTLRADMHRRDLKDLGISDGASGFRFVLPAPLDVYADHVVRVEDRDSGELFGNAPAILRRLAGAPDSLLAPPRDFAAVNLGAVRYEEGAVALDLEAFGRAAAFERPACDEAEVEVLGRTAIAERPFAALGVPATRLSLRLRPHAGAVALRLRFAEAEGDSLACENTVPARLPDYLADIGRENMERVCGPGEQVGRFAAVGLAIAARLEAMTRLHFGRGLAECGRCLDWGAGPGRVALPLARIVAPGLALTAADVDEVNVAFGRAHVAGVDFAETPFLPPLPFADGSFGAIYGVSVFTHLTEAAQFAWLAELRRLVPAGAPVIMSVHNDYSALRAMQGAPDALSQFARRGFSDHLADENLGPKLRVPGYYRATFHTERYLRERWTEAFEILHIYPCGNGSMQDFVVMRAK